MYIKNVVSIDINEEWYIIEVGITLNCTKIQVDRNSYDLMITSHPHNGEGLVKLMEL